MQTPHWTRNGKIQLSAGEQVAITLKHHPKFRSWAKLLKWEMKLIKVHGQSKQEDIDIINRIWNFERKNRVKFRYSETCGVYWIPLKKRGGSRA